MLKLRCYAVAQQPQITRRGRGKLDGWNEPLQTIYLKRNSFQRLDAATYRTILEHQLVFFARLNEAIEQEQQWFIDHGYDRLPKIHNDPRAYTMEEIITDIFSHYENSHDPCLSMILRQNYLADRLAQELDADQLKQQYSIELDIQNIMIPELARYRRHNLIGQNTFSTQASQAVFKNLFERS